MIFTFISSQVDPTSTPRIAAQIITGMGFLGAGVILKGEIEGKTKSEVQESGHKVVNLTTAASIWFWHPLEWQLVLIIILLRLFQSDSLLLFHTYQKFEKQIEEKMMNKYSQIIIR